MDNCTTVLVRTSFIRYKGTRLCRDVTVSVEDGRIWTLKAGVQLERGIQVGLFTGSVLVFTAPNQEVSKL